MWRITSNQERDIDPKKIYECTLNGLVMVGYTHVAIGMCFLQSSAEQSRLVPGAHAGAVRPPLLA